MAPNHEMAPRSQAPIFPPVGAWGPHADLTAQYNTLRRRWKAILAALAASLSGALVLLLLLTPRYTATTRILFDPRKQDN